MGRSSPPCAPGVTRNVPVVDTSAIVDVLLALDPNPQLRERVSQGDLHAPHLIDVEFVNVVRRFLSAGRITVERADAVRSDFTDLPIVRYPHGTLLDRMWELRHNPTAYDAAYVALSAALEVPLVTTDSRLAASPGPPAWIATS